MKWFWYSLIGFCLLMCSCKSKNLSKSVGLEEHRKDGLRIGHLSVLDETNRTLSIVIDKSRLRIIETIKITEYDKDSGKPTKETDAKREIIQNSNKVASEEEQKRIEAARQDSLNQFRKVTKKMESETEEETKGGQEAFGKWLGIILGLAFVALIIYIRIKKKLRVS